MKEGEFDRLRIPLEEGSGVADANAEGVGAGRTGVAASPAQLAAGSAILAGLILLGVAAIRRRRGSGPRGAEGPG